MFKNAKIRLISLLLVFTIISNIIVLPKRSKAIGLTPTIGFFITCMVSAVGYAVFTDQSAIQKVNIDLFKYLQDKGHKVGDIAKTAQAYALLKLTNSLTMPVPKFNQNIKNITTTIKNYFVENEKKIKDEIKGGYHIKYYGSDYTVKITPVSDFTGYAEFRDAYYNKRDGFYTCPNTGVKAKIEYINGYDQVRIKPGEFLNYGLEFPRKPDYKGWRVDYNFKTLKTAYKKDPKINQWTKIKFYNVKFTLYHYADSQNEFDIIQKGIEEENLDVIRELAEDIYGHVTSYLISKYRGIPNDYWWPKRGTWSPVAAYNLSYSFTPPTKDGDQDISTPKRDLAMPKLPSNVQNTNIQDIDKLMDQLYNNKQFLEDLVNQNNTVSLPNGILKDDVIIVNPNIKDIAGINAENTIGITENGLKEEDLLNYLTDNPLIIGSINNVINKALVKDIADLKEEQERSLALLNTLQADVLANRQAVASTADQVTTLSDTLTTTMTDVKDFFKPKTEVKLDLDYFKNLTLPNKFPFSIPYDFLRVVKTMQANKKAPVFKIQIKNVSKTIDFSQFEYFAKIFRNFLYTIFLVALILNTKRLLGDR